jgi:hypothetical protein
MYIAHAALGWVGEFREYVPVHVACGVCVVVAHEPCALKLGGACGSICTSSCLSAVSADGPGAMCAML